MNKIRPRRKSCARQAGLAGGANAGTAQEAAIRTDAAGAGDGEARDRVNGGSDRQAGV